MLMNVLFSFLAVEKCESNARNVRSGFARLALFSGDAVVRRAALSNGPAFRLEEM
jgi:hypothetical protein